MPLRTVVRQTMICTIILFTFTVYSVLGPQSTHPNLTTTQIGRSTYTSGVLMGVTVCRRLIPTPNTKNEVSENKMCYKRIGTLWKDTYDL